MNTAKVNYQALRLRVSLGFAFLYRCRRHLRELLTAFAILTATALHTNAQTNGQRFIPRDFSIIPVFSNNAVAMYVITNLLNDPQPELAVPAISQTNSGPAWGTFWMLEGPAVPLPLDPFPGLDFYEVGTNQYIIDTRSVDFAALDELQQAENEALGLTNQTITTSSIDTNGLWIQVPASSLATPQNFNVNVINTVQAQPYDILTKVALPIPTWAIELTVTGAVGNITPVQLPMNGRTNLFIWARTSTSHSFYLVTEPLSQDVYDGDAVTFYVETGGNTNLTFQWTFDGAAIPGATNSTYTIDNVQDSDAGYYACIVSDGANSLITGAAQLTTESSSGDTLLTPIVSSRQNYVFKSGMTYYIGSPIQLFGNTVIEAGATLKFDFDSATDSSLIIMGGLICKTGPYNFATLTSIDDDANGEWIPTSTGSPQTYITGVPYLDLTSATSNSISNLRFLFADWGVTTPVNTPRLDVWDCQFGACDYGIVNLVAGNSTNSLHNVLFAQCEAGIGASSNSITIQGEHVTADVADFCFAPSEPSLIALTNSIVWGNALSASKVLRASVQMNPDSTNFVAVGEGNYYLAPGSPLHQMGTAGISPRLQSELQNKTTYPPISIADGTQISGQINLARQAPRYTNGVPDIGYFYDVLDYTVGSISLSGTLNVLPGTAVGIRNDFISDGNGGGYWTIYGFYVYQGGTIISHGTPNKPNVFVAADSVQETPNVSFAAYRIGYSRYAGDWLPGLVSFVSDFEPSDTASPTLDFRFSNFYLPTTDLHFASGVSCDSFWIFSSDSSINLNLQDCAVHGGQIDIGQPDGYDWPADYVFGSGTVTWNTTLFDNVNINLDPTYYETGADDQGLNVDLSFEAKNNLFHGGQWFHVEPIPASAGNWTFENNLFDQIDFVQDVNQPLDFDYNGYWPLSASAVAWDWNCYPWYQPNTNYLQTTITLDGFADGNNEQFMVAAPSYQHGPFGDYYLSNNTVLYGTGSDTAANLGLYHYTTRIDQVKEGDEPATHNVNIGLHYIAADANGFPKDYDSDGIPDYVENWHGDGNYSQWIGTETDWQNPMTDGVMPDPSNTVYDNVDLDGDGLPGAAERFFGTNPLIPDNPLDMATILQQGSISGLAQIPLNIGTNVAPDTSFVLQINGLPRYTAVYQTNGNWFAEWNSVEFGNGTYEINLEYDLDENNPIMGMAKFVNVQNNVCFPGSLPICGGALYVQPQTINTNGNYTLTVYDDQTNVVTSFSGSIDNNGFCDDTNTGLPGISVSLLDTNENQLPSEWFTVNVTTYPATVTSQGKHPNTPNPPGGGSSGTNTVFYSHPFGGRRWVIAYYPAYGNAQEGNQAALDLGEMMEGSAQIVHSSQYGTMDDGVVNNINSSWGNPLSISLDGAKQWAQVQGLLGDNRSENLFYFGHGAPDFIGVKGGNNISSSNLVSILSNNITSGINTLYGVQKHPYRFVFLDGCDTAKGNLPTAFGIPNVPVPDSDWPGKYYLPPRSFLGWNSHIANSVKGTMPASHKLFIEGFWGAWGSANGAQLRTSLNNANPILNYATGLYEPCSLAKSIIVYGDPDLPFFQ